MSILLLSKELKDKNFAIYEIDPFCSYAGLEDMIKTNIPNVVITLCDDPKNWLEENTGMNEVPLAYVVNNRITRTFFGQMRQLKVKAKS